MNFKAQKITRQDGASESEAHMDRMPWWLGEFPRWKGGQLHSTCGRESWAYPWEWSNRVDQCWSPKFGSSTLIVLMRTVNDISIAPLWLRQLPQEFMPVVPSSARLNSVDSTSSGLYEPLKSISSFLGRTGWILTQNHRTILSTAAMASQVRKVLWHQRDRVQQETLQPDVHQGDSCGCGCMWMRGQFTDLRFTVKYIHIYMIICICINIYI